MRTLPVPQQAADLRKYIKKQRQTILVSRLSRDPGFGSMIKNQFNHACAVCGVQLEIIEGAHIIPITEDNSEDEIWNGIALCPNHHKLFDSLAFAIDPAFRFCVNHARIEFLRSSGRADGAEREVIVYENKPVLKPRFFASSVRDRGRLLSALEQHRKRAIIL